MPVKMTGKQWKEFYQDPGLWFEGRYHDDQIVHLNGERSERPVSDPDSVSDTDIVEVVYGDVMHKGVYTEDFPDMAKRWLSREGESLILISCPPIARQSVQIAVMEAGGTIVEVVNPEKDKNA